LGKIFIRKEMHSNVILIRHAEKLDWKQGNRPTAADEYSFVDNHLLSLKGVERSFAYQAYFTTRKEFVDLYKSCPLTTLIAQDVSTKGKGKSYRPRDTLAPLSRYQHTLFSLVSSPLNFKLYCKSEINDLVKSIKDGVYQGQTVIICWNHKELGMLARLLGATDAPEWPKGRYDVTWVVQIGEQITFKQYPQFLMYGDLDLIH
jgi:hypothetical protein